MRAEASTDTPPTPSFTSADVALELADANRRYVGWGEAETEVRRRRDGGDEQSAAREPARALGGAVTTRRGRGSAGLPAPTDDIRATGESEAAALTVRAVLRTVAGHVEETGSSVRLRADGRTEVPSAGIEATSTGIEVAELCEKNA